MSTLRVFAFSGDWGLPTTGPFALKLLAWLELAHVPYELIAADDPRKGPKGKSPWVELNGERIGDSDIIIERLSRLHGIDLDERFSVEQRAIGHAWRLTFEEHFHQVLEWELLLHPAGAAYMRALMQSRIPRPMGGFVFAMMQSHFRKQLHARGIARHAPQIIETKGRADIDALAGFLGDRPFLVGDRPSSADTAVFGLLAPAVNWPMKTPVAQYARSVPAIAGYCERMYRMCFGKNDRESGRAAAE
jgi:glutathione S-transferase